LRKTLARAWQSLSIIGKIKIFLGLVWSSFKQPDIEELKKWIDSIMEDPNSDVLSKSIKELSAHFPTIVETIIHERDRYMGCKLLQTGNILGKATLEDGKPRTIVAVVGAGHCPGIINFIEEARKKPESLSGVQDSLQKIVETKKLKVDSDENLKLLLTAVQSIS